MGHKFSIGKFPSGKRDYLFRNIPFIPENVHWDEPKSRVPFTTRPEFPEIFGKWKTLVDSSRFQASMADPVRFSRKSEVHPTSLVFLNF